MSLWGRISHHLLWEDNMNRRKCKGMWHNHRVPRSPRGTHKIGRRREEEKDIAAGRKVRPREASGCRIAVAWGIARSEPFPVYLCSWISQFFSSFMGASLMCVGYIVWTALSNWHKARNLEGRKTAQIQSGIYHPLEKKLIIVNSEVKRWFSQAGFLFSSGMFLFMFFFCFVLFFTRLMGLSSLSVGDN